MNLIKKDQANLLIKLINDQEGEDYKLLELENFAKIIEGLLKFHDERYRENCIQNQDDGHFVPKADLDEKIKQVSRLTQITEAIYSRKKREAESNKMLNGINSYQLSDSIALEKYKDLRDQTSGLLHTLRITR